jgi:hypothetical protein
MATKDAAKPTYLTLHEFDEGSFASGPPTTLLGDSQATKQMASTARKLDVALFKLQKGFGDVDARWTTDDEKGL